MLGVYTSLGNAQRAGDRWLREKRASHPDGSASASAETRFSEWKVEGKGGDWEKEKAWSGLGFLESRKVRIKKCEVRADSSVSEEKMDEERWQG